MDDVASGSEQPITRLTLDLRGTRYTIEQEMLMNLPESVLLCLFPNGLILSRQPGNGNNPGLDAQASSEADREDEEEEEVYMVDFDPACLSFVLQFFRNAQEHFYGIPGKPSSRALFAQTYTTQQQPFGDADYDTFGGVPGALPLMTKQAIIVLREELEYFSIPPKILQKEGINGVPIEKLPGPDEIAADPKAAEVPANTVTTPSLLLLKQQCGSALLDRRQIFTALQRNVNKENNMAEQHLIDMLCMSGFSRDDAWGFRALEPNRCCITSIALVLLKTGITFPEEPSPSDGRVNMPPKEGDIDVDQQQLNTAQKLLLFWRKPARKCWWDGVDVVLPIFDNERESEQEGVLAADTSALSNGGMTAAEEDLLRSGRGRKTRVWARRVWTLELSLI